MANFFTKTTCVKIFFSKELPLRGLSSSFDANKYIVFASIFQLIYFNPNILCQYMKTGKNLHSECVFVSISQKYGKFWIIFFLEYFKLSKNLLFLKCIWIHGFQMLGYGQIHLPLTDGLSIKSVITKTFLFIIRIQWNYAKL